MDYLKFQEDLSIQYGYKKLPDELSNEVKTLYLQGIPQELNINGDMNFEIRSKCGTLISKGYDRIVIGDYGAFIEIGKEKIFNDNLICEIGQEYRYKDKKYANNVKYLWFTTKDESHIKIYIQKKTVSYADYKSNMIYVSPFEILL